MLTGLSAEILSYIERHELGVKLVDLQERIRRPHQEIEAAVSQLKRQQLIEQRVPGIWTRTNNNTGRKEPEPNHGRIVETGIVDPPTANIPPRAIKAPTEEIRMEKGKKTCSKCGDAKGPTAFSDYTGVCRKCQKGKASKPTKQKLRTIVERHIGRPTDAVTAAIAELEAKRYDIDQAIEVLKKVA